MPYIKSVCIAGKTKEIEKYYARYAQPLGGSRQVKQNKTTEKQIGRASCRERVSSAV